MGRICQLCSAHINSEETGLTHLAGRKHQTKQKYLSIMDVNPNNTIFITGFPSQKTSLHLEKILEKIVCVKWMCNAKNVWNINHCIAIEYLSFEDANAALNGLIPKYKVEFQRDISNLPLIMPPNEPDQNCSERTLDDSRTSGFKALQWCLHNILNMTYSCMTPSDWTSLSTEGNQHFIEISLEKLVNLLELSQSDFQQREILRCHIEQFLQVAFPGTQAFAFGSSVNGLGFQNCDLDMYVDTGMDPWMAESVVQQRNEAARLCRRLEHLIRKSGEATELISIPRCRVPIVRFRDRESRIQVDLSFRHGLSVQNSNLIRFYAYMHKQIRPYMMFLRLWGKAHDIVGGSQPTTLLNNYTFTMMMLFSLMVQPLALIPPVVRILSDDAVINGWPCGLNTMYITPKPQDVSIIRLIQQFFVYYSSTDFTSIVISPFVDRPIRRDYLTSKKLSVLGHEFSVYCFQDRKFETKCDLPVQDPFDHASNLSRPWRTKCFARFRLKCRQAVTFCEKIMKGDAPLCILFDTSEAPMLIESLKNPITLDPSKVPLSTRRANPLMDPSVLVPNVRSNHITITLDDEEEVQVVDLRNKLKDKKLIGDSKRLNKIDLGVTAGQEGNADSQSKSNVTVTFKSRENDIILLDEFPECPNSISSLKDFESEASTSSNSEIIEVSSTDDLLLSDNVRHKTDVVISGDPFNLNFDQFEYKLSFPSVIEFEVFNLSYIKVLGSQVMRDKSAMATQLYNILRFLLTKCLCVELVGSPESIALVKGNHGKRKLDSIRAEELPAKRQKTLGFKNSLAINFFEKVSSFACKSSGVPFRKREQAALKSPYNNGCPLQYESQITQSVVRSQRDESCTTSYEYTGVLFQCANSPEQFLLRMYVDKGNAVIKSSMMEFFVYFSSLVNLTLRRLNKYVNERP